MSWVSTIRIPAGADGDAITLAVSGMTIKDMSPEAQMSLEAIKWCIPTLVTLSGIAVNYDHNDDTPPLQHDVEVHIAGYSNPGNTPAADGIRDCLTIHVTQL